jgi:hypothetical protein
MREIGFFLCLKTQRTLPSARRCSCPTNSEKLCGLSLSAKLPIPIKYKPFIFIKKVLKFRGKKRGKVWALKKRP